MIPMYRDFATNGNANALSVLKEARACIWDMMQRLGDNLPDEYNGIGVRLNQAINTLENAPVESVT